MSRSRLVLAAVAASLMSLQAGAEVWRSADGVRASLVSDEAGVALCIVTRPGLRLSGEAGILLTVRLQKGSGDDPAFRHEWTGEGYLRQPHRHAVPAGWPLDRQRLRAEFGVCSTTDDACLPVTLEFPVVRTGDLARPDC